MNGKKPNKEQKKWIDAILEHGCVVCRNEMSVFTPAEIHHINGGSNHLEAIGLCFFHHRQGGNTPQYVSRHPNKHEFELRYGTEADLLLQLQAEIGEL